MFIQVLLSLGKLMVASIVLYIDLLNKMVLNFKVFKLMPFLWHFL